MENKNICSKCKEEILYSHERMYNKEGALFCTACFDEIYIFCHHCRKQVKKEDIITSQRGDKYCQECYDGLFITCSGCDGELLRNDARIPPDDTSGENIYCEDCFWEIYTNCSSCNNVFFTEDLVSDEDGCLFCEDCWGRDHVEGLFAWDYKPEPIFLSTERDSKTNQIELFFGIELEVENIENVSTRKEEIAKLPKFVYAKEDSSINCGFEIVSHPATWNWLKKNKEKWESILEIRKRGYKSYNTSTCGMHIHLSKDAFGGIHLFKFLKLFYENPSFILVASCRKSRLLEAYASITGDGSEGLVYKAKTKDACGAYRHTAINLANPDTIEVRIFRGTLDPAGFWRNLEFTKSAFEFTKQCSIRDTTAENYLKYVVGNRKSYRNLVEFLERKELLNICWQPSIPIKKEKKNIGAEIRNAWGVPMTANLGEISVEEDNIEWHTDNL